MKNALWAPVTTSPTQDRWCSLPLMRGRVCRLFRAKNGLSLHLPEDKGDLPSAGGWVALP